MVRITQALSTQDGAEQHQSAPSMRKSGHNSVKSMRFKQKTCRYLPADAQAKWSTLNSCRMDYFCTWTLVYLHGGICIFADL